VSVAVQRVVASLDQRRRRGEIRQRDRRAAKVYYAERAVAAGRV